MKSNFTLRFLICRCYWPIAICALLFVFSQPAALADRASTWGRLTLGSRHHEVDQQFLVDALVPVWRNHHTLFAGTVRGSFVESREQQFGGGLVLRHVTLGENLLLGLHVSGDRKRAASGNAFRQVGGGLEVLSAWVDLRANYYYPLTDRQIVDAADVRWDCDACPNGERGNGVPVFYEEALEGVDGELGVWIPWVDQWVPTAVYFGYARFSREHGDALEGFQGRLESRLHPNLTLDVNWYENRNVQGADYYAGLRFQMPLDFWNGWRYEKPRSREVRYRMEDMIQREWQVHTLLSREGVGGIGAEALKPTGTGGTRPDEREPICYLDSDGEVVCE